MAKGYYTPKKKMHWALKLLLFLLSLAVIAGLAMLGIWIYTMCAGIDFVDFFHRAKDVVPTPDNPNPPVIEAGKMLIGYCLG